MKNANCGNCPLLHRCIATNDNECIDTIIGKKHYISDREKQIKTELLDKVANELKTKVIICDNCEFAEYIDEVIAELKAEIGVTE